MLTLRTRLAYLNSQAAIQAAPRVAELMQLHMGWSDQDREEQLQAALVALREFGGPIPAGKKSATRTQLPEDIRGLFKILDLDNNGYLDYQEIVTGAEMLGFPFGTALSCNCATIVLCVIGQDLTM